MVLVIVVVAGAVFSFRNKGRKAQASGSKIMESKVQTGNLSQTVEGTGTMISLIGCGIGIFLSWLIILIAGKIVTTMTFSLSMGIVWIAVAFSACIGVGFGIYPANKAAKKKPIEALRFS